MGDFKSGPPKHHQKFTIFIMKNEEWNSLTKSMVKVISLVRDGQCLLVCGCPDHAQIPPKSSESKQLSDSYKLKQEMSQPCQ